jgi:hypothetical protein
MKKTLLFAALVCFPFLAFSEEIPGVSYSIRPDPYVSSDQVSICRVTVTNQSGRTLDGRRLVFEAAALENGVAVVFERGRFGGIVRSGDTVETLIGFSGGFRDFTVSPAEGAGGASHTARRRKGSARASGRAAGSQRRRKR